MKNLLYTLSLLLLGVMVVSCGDDDPVTPPVPAPVANFTSVIDGKMVTYTSTSTNATSFAWEFGDGETSTEESPTHTYAKNGSFVTKLTVTNETDSDSKQDVLEIINIAIDGDLSDWDDVELALIASDGFGTVTGVKFENLDNNKLFVYVEGTADLSPLTQIYLNTDNDTTTGALIDWQFPRGGEDILIEGGLTAGADQYGSIYPCDPCTGSPGNWNWAAAPTNENIADFIVASEIVSIPGGSAYELVIDLTALGVPIDSDAIGVAVADMDIDTWGPVGASPKFFEATDNPFATLYLHSF